jgi:iron complex outermembrane recepter protein
MAFRRFIGSLVWWDLVAALIVALLPADTMAQTGTSTITGIVRDSSGAAIPGAIVRVVNEDSGMTVEAVSDGQGAYRAAALSPGQYRVETTLDGFENAARRLVLEGGRTAAVDVTLNPARFTQSVVVTARRVEELAQEVPIPVSVVRGDLVADAGAFNVNRLKEMIPTVQFYSTNPRNSAINIRGLGAPFGLTNDGIEPGVGLYIDGVFYARPASATLDFLDVDRVEVLRGPQGSLFGKNTTAGAINVTTRKPSFTPGGEFELNYGDLGFVQAKASITGPLFKKFAGRLSFSGTQRDGTLFNTRTQDDVNDLNNLGARGQLVFAPSDAIAVTAAADHTRQRAEGYTQVVAGVVPTLRPPSRQYPQIAADLGYTPPSFNAFDRTTDIDSPLQSYQDLGGASLTIDWKLGRGRLNSTTAWRYWDWDPSNDRDFIGLPVTTISAGTSKQRQWTQEVRYTGDVSPRLNFVAGTFVLPPGDRLRPGDQAGTGRGGGALSAGADPKRGDARSARWVRLQPVPQVSECQRGAVRPARMDSDRSLAAAARPPVQLRSEKRGLRSAGLRRPADHQPRADRFAALGPCATELQSRCR